MLFETFILACLAGFYKTIIFYNNQISIFSIVLIFPITKNAYVIYITQALIRYVFRRSI